MIFGCCDTIGPQAGDIARTCWLAAGLPEHVPGVTIDRQCGSSQQAVHFAAQAVMSGTADLVVAGGVQNMSMIPISSAMTARAAARLRGSLRGLEGLGGALRHAGGLAVPRRRDDRREVGHLARGHGGLRPREPPARDPRDRRGALRERDRAPRRRAQRRGPAPRHEPREDGEAPDAPAGRAPHRGAGEPDLGRRVGAARRVGAGGEGARPAARARASTTSACAPTTRSTC